MWKQNSGEHEQMFLHRTEQRKGDLKCLSLAEDKNSTRRSLNIFIGRILYRVLPENNK